MTNSRFLVRSSSARPLARGRGGLLGTLLGWIRYELHLRRDIQHLQRLDDSDLADLGLTRGAITGAVRGHHDPRR